MRFLLPPIGWRRESHLVPLARPPAIGPQGRRDNARVHCPDASVAYDDGACATTAWAVNISVDDRGGADRLSTTSDRDTKSVEMRACGS